MEILKILTILMVLFVAAKWAYTDKLYEDPNIGWMVLFVVLFINAISPGITGVLCLLALGLIAVNTILKFLAKL